MSAEEVGQIVGFVAPGFFARMAYVGRFPRREPSEFTVLVASVVLSLPLVALTRKLAPLFDVDGAKPTDLDFVVLLLGVSLLAGYLAALVRSWRWSRNLLRGLGLAYQPESSIYAQTLLTLPADATITVEFTDGRKVSGTPKLGPGQAGDEVAELYLTHPAWWAAASGTWIEDGAGEAVIVPLAQVHSVTLDRDST